MTLETVIDHINSSIEGMPFFSQVYGLCENKTHQEISQPVFWSNGKFNVLNYNQLGLVYWRKTTDVSSSDTESFVSGERDYEITYPLRLFAMTKRSLFPNDDAYSPERLSATLMKAMTIKGGTLKKTLKVRQLNTTVSSYSTDTQEIISEEFAGINWADFSQCDLVVAIDVELVVTKRTPCIDDACEYVPKFCLQLESYVALP